ncbi:MAG: divalent metal cation transporter [Chitinophagaceae bacterium]|nr:divalent metal cation transporter [Chitinophagaceae bacterium]
MANSSIGPGFLAQTTIFTQQLMTSFGFVILVSVLIDIGAQLNTWRILAVSEMRAQDVSNALLPGLGYFVSLLVVLGGFAFNIGNIAGCGQGVNILTGLSFQQGAIISGVVALLLFWIREIGKMLDGFTKTLGTMKILLTLFIAFAARPPLGKAVENTILPESISMIAIVTIVGGTVGGYLTFSGAHRLIDAGIKGKDQLRQVDRSAISGITISTIMRFILFLAAAGVLSQGAVLTKGNEASTVFHFAAGEIGLRIFGVVLWSAAISSVVGASYTSVSFFKTFHPLFVKYERVCISLFIIATTCVFVAIGKPTELQLFAGAVNGLILPIALSVILIAATKKRIMKDYRHPIWMQIAGWLVVGVMSWMGYTIIEETVRKFF